MCVFSTGPVMWNVGEKTPLRLVGYGLIPSLILKLFLMIVLAVPILILSPYDDPALQTRTNPP